MVDNGHKHRLRIYFGSSAWRDLLTRGVVQLFIPSWDGEFACTGPGLRGLQCDRDYQCEDRVCSVQGWEGEGFRKMVVLGARKPRNETAT